MGDLLSVGNVTSVGEDFTGEDTNENTESVFVVSGVLAAGLFPVLSLLCRLLVVSCNCVFFFLKHEGDLSFVGETSGVVGLFLALFLRRRPLLTDAEAELVSVTVTAEGDLGAVGEYRDVGLAFIGEEETELQSVLSAA